VSVPVSVSTVVATPVPPVEEALAIT